MPATSWTNPIADIIGRASAKEHRYERSEDYIAK